MIIQILDNVIDCFKSLYCIKVIISLFIIIINNNISSYFSLILFVFLFPIFENK